MLYGVCNVIWDILIKVDDNEFSSLGLERGRTVLVDKLQQQALRTKLSGVSVQRSGGSVANSIVCYSQLGGKCGIIGQVANDTDGFNYIKELKDLKIHFPLNPLPSNENLASGSCIVVVTPDGERTMNTFLGASTHLSEEVVTPDCFNDATWVLLEGYLLANPHYGVPLVEKVLKIAKEKDLKLAFTCSEPWVVNSFKDRIHRILAQAEVFVCNEDEVQALYDTTDTEEAFSKLCLNSLHAVVTLGSRGAKVWCNNEITEVTAIKCNSIDATGAGDAFIGTYLYAINHGYSTKEAAIAACNIAGATVQQIGARLSDAKLHFKIAR
jgi:sugar/nucleoside kinase (ribokinase family)